MSILLSIWTVVVLVVFLGIVIWAWSDRNKASFEEAARIPLNDEQDPVSAEQDRETTDNG